MKVVKMTPFQANDVIIKRSQKTVSIYLKKKIVHDLNGIFITILRVLYSVYRDFIYVQKSGILIRD